MQLLGLHWAGHTPTSATSRSRELKSLQRPDGGWGQTPFLPSDAYATGQVVYTLRELGVPAADPSLAAWRRLSDADAADTTARGM